MDKWILFFRVIFLTSATGASQGDPGVAVTAGGDPARPGLALAGDPARTLPHAEEPRLVRAAVQRQSLAFPHHRGRAAQYTKI